MAILLNLGVLGVSLYAATGSDLARAALPLVVFGGALIKPQFIVYAGLLLLIEQPLKRAAAKAVAVIVAAGSVHAVYTQLRPDDWREYTDALLKRTVVEKDFAWGPAGFIKQFSDANSAAFAAFVIGFLIVAALAYQAWRRSQQVAAPARVSLVFVALTFANPRMPPYDVFVALLALAVCCAYAAQPKLLTRLLGVLLAINLVPWVIKEFTRAPGAWPGVLQNVQLGHLLALFGLLAALALTGLEANEPEERRIGV